VNDATAAGWHEAATAIIIAFVILAAFIYLAMLCDMYRQTRIIITPDKPKRRPAKKAVKPRPARSKKRVAESDGPPIKNRPKLISPRPKAAKTGRKG
jgi:hypothetical protein